MFYTSDSLAFRLRGIRAGDHPIDCSIDPVKLGVLEATGPIGVRGTLTADGDSFLFRLVISASLRHTCDRCAEEYVAKYAVPVDVYFTPLAVDEQVGDPSYVHSYDPVTLVDVDLGEDVHDALLLAVPMKKLCSEDCGGVPGAPIATPVEDERFSALGSLRDRLRSEESAP